MWPFLPALLRWGLNAELLRPLVARVLKPAARFAVGLVAVPVFRWGLRAVRLQAFDRELEKDLEEWFAASALLLLCTANVERLLFSELGFEPGDFVSLGFRLLLAVGVVEAMPDAQLFPVLYPKPEVPPASAFGRDRRWFGLRDALPAYLKSHAHQWLTRSSPVFAILACVIGGVTDADGAVPPDRAAEWTAGWCCYGAAVTQYLVMGLMASKEQAASVLAAYDARVAAVREELVAELAVGAACPLPPRPAPPVRPSAAPAAVAAAGFVGPVRPPGGG